MSEKPNVILFIFDTLRPDFLSCYDGGVETPTFDYISDNGSVFEQAYAAGPGTPISHAAIFSGQYPSETGVVGQTTVPENIPLIATHLRDAGYDTFGISGPGRMASDYGYDRGFNEYFETYSDDHPGYTSVDFVKRLVTDPNLRQPLLHGFVEKAVNGPDSHTSFKFNLLKQKLKSGIEKPFFSMVNTTIVHGPYNPPRPYKEKATPELDRSRWFFLDKILGKEEVLDRDDVRTERIYNAQTTDGIARYLADPSYLNDKELEILQKWYAASIRYLDDQLGQFMDWFNKSQFANNTIIILTADHGEHFGEKDLLVHSHKLFKECLHVPLIFNGPNVPSGQQYSRLVSLIDLFPTICDLISIPSPDPVSGQSAFATNQRDAVFSEYGVPHRKREGHRKYMSEGQLIEFGLGRKGIRTKDYLYIYDSNGQDHLYTRPEENEITNPNESIVSDLRSKLFQTLGSEFQSVHDHKHLDEDIKTNLERLGYM